MEIATIIRQHYQELSNGKRAVADYICANKHICAYCSATELAQQAGVSNAQIVKFVKSIGLSNYKQMQGYIREEVEKLEDMSAARTLEEWGQYETGDLRADCMKIALQDCANIENSINALSFDEFNEAAKAIAQARQVAFVGVRSTAGCNNHPAIYIGEMRPNVFNIYPGMGNGGDMLKWWGSKDVVIGVNTYTYGSDFILDMLEVAMSRGCKTILFTDAETYIKTKLANYNYIFQYTATNALVSYTSLMALFNILEYLVARHIGPSAAKNILQTERLLRGQPLLPADE